MSKILEGNPTKKAYSKDEYTQEQLEELSKCCDEENGHMYWITNYGYVKHAEKGRMLYKPFNYQEKLIDVYHNYKFSISMLGRQMGKALAEDTLIITPNGFRTIRELAVGDFVYNEAGVPVEIKNKTEKQIERNCYKIQFEHSDNIIADENHLWKVHINENEKETILSTKELLEHMDNDNVISIKSSKCLEFEKKPVLYKPYDIGVRVANTLKNIDVESNRSILKNFIYNSMDIRLELLKGLMDTIGYVDNNGINYFEKDSIEVITDVRLLLSTLGIKSKLDFKDIKTYELSFTCTEYDIYTNKNNLRKQYNVYNKKENYFFYIKNITKSNSLSVYCIEVNNDSHLFLAGETLVPTHNCVTDNTNIKVRNKKSGEILNITIEEFYKKFI